MLAVENLMVRYGAIQAVRGISLRVAAGEIVALLGANGAGKSSILNACVGLAAIAAGSIALDGRKIDGRRTEEIVRLGMTLTPEGRRVFPHLSVAENLEIGAAASRNLRQAAKGRKEEMLTLFPALRDRQRQLAGTLSGGEQQMLAIARSLMSSPRLLLLDEPSLGLAPTIVDRIFDLILELKRQAITILLVEQNVERSLEIADRGYVIANGAISLEGAAADLRRAGGVERAYLGIG